MDALVPKYLFVILIAIAVIYLFRVDRDESKPFKLIQFITNPDGTGNSASLAYCVALLVSTWVIWAMQSAGTLTAEIFWGYTGTFVAGGVARAAIVRATPTKPPGDSNG